MGGNEAAEVSIAHAGRSASGAARGGRRARGGARAAAALFDALLGQVLGAEIEVVIADAGRGDALRRRDKGRAGERVGCGRDSNHHVEESDHVLALCDGADERWGQAAEGVVG